MWLITTAIFAVVSSLLALLLSGKYRLGTLSLMFWGATLMIFIDHLIGWLREGGPFLEIETEGWVSSSIVLGMLMAVPVIACWIGMLLLKRQGVK